MQVMVLAREGEQSETVTPPSAHDLAEFEKYNDELVKAGVVVAAGGLVPSSKGKRVQFDGKKRSVLDGPFAEAKEMVGGYWLWQVRSMDEAVEWLKRAPFNGGIFEIREIFQTEEALTR